jgi:hypothetical protein
VAGWDDFTAGFAAAFGGLLPQPANITASAVSNNGKKPGLFMGERSKNWQ